MPQSQLLSYVQCALTKYQAEVHYKVVFQSNSSNWAWYVGTSSGRRLRDGLGLQKKQNNSSRLFEDEAMKGEVTRTKLAITKFQTQRSYRSRWYVVQLI